MFESELKPIWDKLSLKIATALDYFEDGDAKMANEKVDEAYDLNRTLYDKAKGVIEILKAENTALRERLKGAVELPFKVGSAVYRIQETDEEDEFNPSIDTGKVVSFSFDGKLWIYVQYSSDLVMWYTLDDFNKEVYTALEAAEAVLRELRREKENEPNT